MDNTAQIIYLIGFMGSGKTTVGKRIADKLGWIFIDIDEVIEHTTGMKIALIFKEKGEDYFRELERESIKKFGEMSRMVIATGGGAPCFFDNMDAMSHNGITVYLKMSPAALTARLMQLTVEERNQRPLIAGKSEAALLEFVTNTLSKREPFYSSAKLIIQNEDTAELAAERIFKCINL